jgi:hypothetical protein
MFQSPALVDGKELSYEEVAKLATRDLVSNQVSVGVSGVYDRFMSLKLRVDAPHHENLAKWAEIYLRGIRFDPTRALICAKKLANKAADNKRAGDVMVHFLNTASTYAPGWLNIIQTHHPIFYLHRSYRLKYAHFWLLGSGEISPTVGQNH